MLDPATIAIAGTIAVGLAERVGGAILDARSDAYFCQLVGKIADKFRTNTPPENHELAKAFRRACLVGMQHACARRRGMLGGKAAPASIFGADEKQWLDKAEAYLTARIKELEQDRVWLPERPTEAYRALTVPKGNVSNAVRIDEFRRMLIADAVAELTQESGAPPDGFVKEMELGWFGLVCDEFQDAIARNQLLANKFQNQTLVEIKSETGVINFKLDEVLEALREMAGKRRPIEHAAVFNLPNLGVAVYDREAETKEVLRALREGRDQFYLVVAPSGFGKSFLLTKVLQNVTDGAAIRPDYQAQVQRIALFDCRVTRTLAKVVGDFADLLGVRLEYAPQAGETPKEWLNKNLFVALRQAGAVWLVLDNFESWLDAESGYALGETEMRVFMNALFEGNHSLRVLCLSQAEPAPDIKRRFKQPPHVGEALYKGLPEQDALAYLRAEGAEVGLDRADESLLKEFLRRVAYIPQALSSLIGYLETIEDYGFAGFMADRELWAGFDDYEHERDEQDEGKRRTKALVAKQISAQSADVKQLLQALAFFGRPTPREALESLFDNKTRAAQAINRLTAHRLVTLTEDSRRSKYYELHAYFREQARKVLPPFENLDASALERYASELAFVKGNEAYNKTYFRRAIEICECAEKIYRLLLEERGRADIENALAGTYMNKGVALDSLGRLPEAIAEYDRAIAIRERLVNEEGRGELANDLARAYMNKGVALRNSGRLPEAIAEYDKAINTYERLVSEEGRDELANDLARAYMNKALALDDLLDWENALACYAEAVRLWIKCVEESGRIELLPYLMRVVSYRFETLFKLERWNEAAQDAAKAILLLLDYSGHPELSEHFKAQTLEHFGGIINLLRGTSAENRQRIYEAAGAEGEILKQLLEAQE